MREKLVKFETAKLAKEKGFDVPSLYSVSGQYKDIIQSSLDFTGKETFTMTDCENAKENTDWEHYLVPTQSLLQKWLRDVHQVNIEAYLDQGGYYRSQYKMIIKKDFVEVGWRSVTKEFKTYEEALEYGLFTGLNLIK